MPESASEPRAPQTIEVLRILYSAEARLHIANALADLASLQLHPCSRARRRGSRETRGAMPEQLDVLYISPERFRASPQVGVPCVMPWESLAAYLSRPSVGASKDAEGGISPALYTDSIRRKANLLHVGALVLDLDEGGDVDRVADVLTKYSAVVHETFSSTADAPRCRAYLQLAEPVEAATYERVHAVARKHLSAVGLVADEGAKDASRLSYAPEKLADAQRLLAALESEILRVGGAR